MYKSVIIGVGGGRAHGHADAYEFVKKGRVVAVCDLRPDAMDEFGDKFDISARYTDYREMFEKEKPELVQVSTPPDVRLNVLEAAETAGVPAAIVEKPLAIQGEDYVGPARLRRAQSQESKWRSIISCNFIRGGSNCSGW